MFENLLKPKTLYLTITAERLYLRHVDERRELEINPTLVVDEKGKIIAIGDAAATTKAQDDNNLTVKNGFQHARSCICDFEAAEAALRHMLAKLSSGLAMLKPRIIMHPLEKLEGGITPVEARALRELGECAGANDVHIWVGRKLRDDELLAMNFPAHEGTHFYEK